MRQRGFRRRLNPDVDRHTFLLAWGILLRRMHRRLLFWMVMKYVEIVVEFSALGVFVIGFVINNFRMMWAAGFLAVGIVFLSQMSHNLIMATTAESDRLNALTYEKFVELTRRQKP